MLLFCGAAKCLLQGALLWPFLARLFRRKLDCVLVASRMPLAMALPSALSAWQMVLQGSRLLVLLVLLVMNWW